MDDSCITEYTPLGVAAKDSQVIALWILVKEILFEWCLRFCFGGYAWMHGGDARCVGAVGVVAPTTRDVADVTAAGFPLAWWPNFF